MAVILAAMRCSSPRFQKLLFAPVLLLVLAGALDLQWGCCFQPGSEPSGAAPDAATPTIGKDAGPDAGIAVRWSDVGLDAGSGDGGLPFTYCDVDGGCSRGAYCKSLILSTCADTSFVEGQQPYWVPHCVNDCSDGSCNCAGDDDCTPPLRCNGGTCGLVGSQWLYCPEPCTLAEGPQGSEFCLCLDFCPTLCLLDSDCPSGDYCDLSYGPCLDDGGVAGICHRDCTQGDHCNSVGCDADDSCGCGADYECPPASSCVVNPSEDTAQCQAVDAGPCPDVPSNCIEDGCEVFTPPHQLCPICALCRDASCHY